MAHSFFNRQDVFRNADPRVHAIYAWLSIEEIDNHAYKQLALLSLNLGDVDDPLGLWLQRRKSRFR